MDFFYCPETYRLIGEGVSKLHRMRVACLVEELDTEYHEKGNNIVEPTTGNRVE